MNSKKKMQQKFAKKFCRKVLNFLEFQSWWIPKKFQKNAFSGFAAEVCILVLKCSSILCRHLKCRECCAHCSQCEGHLSILQFKWMSTQIALHRHRESGRGYMVCINGLQRCLQEERVQIGGIGSWLPSSCLPSTSPGFQAEDPDGTALGHLMTIIFLKDGASGAQRCPLC